MSNRQLIQNLKPYIGDGFFFVNIGANDGVTNDPLYPLIKKYKSSGIVVEPEPIAFEKLKKNLSEFKNIVFENCAISNTPAYLYHLSSEIIGIEPILSQISSFDRGYIETKLQLMTDGLLDENRLTQTPLPSYDVLVNNIIKSSVTLMSFNELMEKHHVTHIDFLNIDAELFDLEILESINMKKYAPTVLCIETIGFSDEKKQAFEKILHKYHYRFLQRFGLPTEIFVKSS